MMLNAYKDAFKLSKPIQFVRKLMFGIYGYEDLLTRCQKDEVENENLVPLCIIKKRSCRTRVIQIFETE